MSKLAMPEKKVIGFREGTADRVSGVIKAEEDFSKFVRQAVEKEIERRHGSAPQEASGESFTLRSMQEFPEDRDILVVTRRGEDISIHLARYVSALSKPHWRRPIFRTRGGTLVEAEGWIDLRSDDLLAVMTIGA